MIKINDSQRNLLSPSSGWTLKFSEMSMTLGYFVTGLGFSYFSNCYMDCPSY